MHFRLMAAIFDLSLPVTSHSTVNMDDISSELNDLGYLGLAFEILTIYGLQAYRQCTHGLAAAILDLPLPVTSDRIGIMLTFSSAD